jgi:peptide deformylase
VTALDILRYPDVRLAQVSVPVVEFGAELARRLVELEETMRAAPGGVGLAAPQVGWFVRVAIVDVSAKSGIAHNGKLVLVNPDVFVREGEAVGREGCLSVPDYTGNVARAERIRLRAFDASGLAREYACEGYEARAVQHEIDHLDGLLFLDRLVSRRELFRRKNYR